MLTMDQAIKGLAALGDDIARLEDTIAFLQGQVLRKRIAQEELLNVGRQAEDRATDEHGRAKPAGNLSGETPDRARETRALPNANLTVRDMVLACRATMNGRPFKRWQLRDRAVERFPDQAGRIDETLVAAAAGLVKTGDLVRRGCWLFWGERER